jgi:hypothetical protein
MEKRSRCGADDGSRSLARERGSESAHAMSGSAMTEALDHRPERQVVSPIVVV